MQAIIMAAGKGVRMHPLTLTVPKPLLKINGRAIIDYTLKALPDEVDEVIIVIGYLGEQIQSYLKNYSKKKLIFVFADKLDGTAQAVSICKSYIKDNFIVLNGDDLYDRSDLQKLVGQQNAWLVQKQEPLPARFNKVIFNEEGFLQDLAPNDGTQAGYAAIGAYTLTPEFFTWELVKTKGGEYGLPQTMLLAAKNGVQVKVITATHWFAIGFPQDLPEAEKYLNHENNS